MIGRFYDIYALCFLNKSRFQTLLHTLIKDTVYTGCALLFTMINGLILEGWTVYIKPPDHPVITGLI